MKEVLSQKNVKFAFVDVTGSIGNLQKFLKVRDTYPVFEAMREQGRVGLPTLFVDDTPHLVDGPEHAEQLIEELRLLDEVE